MAEAHHADGQSGSYLKSILAKYRHKDETMKDVALLFASFRDLRPNVHLYTFKDGSHCYLLCVEGTIPVLFKGNTYNIPIGIWLMDTHPENPPLCCVKPTPDMILKPSEYVDKIGRVYLPYLHEWKTQHPSSDLLGLIQVMSAVFSENMPVFSRGPRSSPQHGRSLLPKPASRRSQEHQERLSGDNASDEEDPSGLCKVCRNTNEVAFQCGHGACQRCYEVLAYCPECKTKITQRNSVTLASANGLPRSERSDCGSCDSEYDAMDSDDKRFAVDIEAMGFHKSRIARGVKMYGRDETMVVDFLFGLETLCRHGYPEERAAEALNLFSNDQEKARDFLRLLIQFETCGFKENDIKQALVIHNNCEDEVFDALTDFKDFN